MKKKLLIMFFLILRIIQSSAQKHELGNVTIEELNEKVCPTDSSAVAMFLFNKGKVRFVQNLNGYNLETEIQVKIKIYKEEGYMWANHEIPFRIGIDEKESVKFLNATTYNLVGGKVEKVKAKIDNDYYKLNKFFGIQKLKMPNIKNGSIVEYKYVIKSPYYSILPEWKFQKSIPVKHSEYIIQIPEYFDFETNIIGSFPIEIQKSFDYKSTSLINKQSSLNLLQSSGLTIISAPPIELKYKENETKYVLNNVPAIKDILFVNNIENYTAGLQFKFISNQISDSSFQNLFITWEDVAKDINKDKSFDEELNKTNYYEEDVKKILKDLSTSEEKLSAIFSFVQSRMTWNKYFSYLCDLGVKKAYEDKIGNTAEINLMLVSMLRYANLDANPVLVSTRSNGVSLFPSRTAYNTVIASVTIDNNVILLDATNKNSQPSILPLRDLNWFGRMIRKDSTSDLVDLMPKSSSWDVVNMLATIDDKGQISGKIREQYLDYNSLRYRENYSGLAKDAIAEKIEKQYKGIEVNDFELINTNLNEPVVEKYSIKNTNASKIIGDKIYFAPMLQYTMSENPFKQETREYPIDFSFPFKDKYMINLTIPDGYQVESTPKPIAIVMDKKYGNFSYTITNASENQIQLSVVLEVNSSIIPSEDYDTLKQFFKVIIEKENEKIILKKI